jgi:hypothetical protein
MSANGIKLILMLLVGFLLIEAGLTGKPGSMLGSIIVPESMNIITPVGPQPPAGM